jgi:flagellar protein FlbD
VIQLHRLGHQHEPFWLNPDLVQVLEANPDTVITLTTGQRLIVSEAPDAIVAAIQEYRSTILRDALGSRHLRPV